jgi:hypothetical protein
MVEAKSVLPSFGDLMRQINLYRAAFRGPVCVVTPTTATLTCLRSKVFSS